MTDYLNLALDDETYRKVVNACKIRIAGFQLNSDQLYDLNVIYNHINCIEEGRPIEWAEDMPPLAEGEIGQAQAEYMNTVLNIICNKIYQYHLCWKGRARSDGFYLNKQSRVYMSPFELNNLNLLNSLPDYNYN